MTTGEIIAREELHKLLDQMLDEGKEVGNISHMTTLPWGEKIENIRLVLQRNEYELPYPAPDKFLTPPIHKKEKTSSPRRS